ASLLTISPSDAFLPPTFATSSFDIPLNQRIYSDIVCFYKVLSCSQKLPAIIRPLVMAKLFYLIVNARQVVLQPVPHFFQCKLAFFYFIIHIVVYAPAFAGQFPPGTFALIGSQDRKSTRLNSSHVKMSYAGFCLKKKVVYCS